MSSESKVFITGIGFVGPSGEGMAAFGEAVRRGDCFVRPLPSAMVPQDRPAVGAPFTGDRSMEGRSFRMLQTACAEAIASLSDDSRKELPVILGTSLGDIDTLLSIHKAWLLGSAPRPALAPWIESGETPQEEHTGTDSVADEQSPEKLEEQRSRHHGAGPDELGRHIASSLGLEGPRITFSCACTSGSSALGAAFDWIRTGKFERCLVSAVDSLNDFVLCGFSSLWALSSSPPRPFDRSRTGMTLGEAAVAFLVESPEAARRSSCRVRAVMTGYGASCDAVHITAPDRLGRGASRTMAMAMDEACWQLEDLDYINVHATGSVFNDAMIAAALRDLAGERRFPVPVSSVNPCTGHTLGAAGLAELAATVLAMEESFIPPTANLTDPEAEDIDLVMGSGREAAVKRALSLTTGFGGANTTIALERPSEETNNGVSVEAGTDSEQQPAGNLTATTGGAPPVVVTGLAVLGPWGTERRIFRSRLSGALETSAANQRTECIPPLDFFEIVGTKNKRTRRADRLSRLVSIAAKLAIDDARLVPGAFIPGRSAVVSGSCRGAAVPIFEFHRQMLENGPEAVNPNIFPSTSHNVAGGHASIEFGCSGPLVHFASGRLSSSFALSYGAGLLALDRADLVLACGWELGAPECLLPARTAGDELAGRPVETVVVAVLEREEDAIARDAEILARLDACHTAAGARPHNGQVSRGLRACLDVVLPAGPSPGLIFSSVTARFDALLQELTTLGGAATIDGEEFSRETDCPNPERNAPGKGVIDLLHRTGDSGGAAGLLALAAAVEYRQIGESASPMEAMLVVDDPGGEAWVSRLRVTGTQYRA